MGQFFKNLATVLILKLYLNIHNSWDVCYVVIIVSKWFCKHAKMLKIIFHKRSVSNNVH